MRILILMLLAGQASPQFEVASVRRNLAAGCQGRWDFHYSHGTVSAENAPLRRIVSRAFQITDDRVSGPGWLDSECYDIRAKAGGPVTDEELGRRLQGLLAERFHMVARMESEERPIFALTVDKGGPKIHAYGDKVAAPAVSGAEGRVLFMVRHMPDLCERIGKVLGGPVVDWTGLTGDYSIVLTYAPMSANGDAADGGLDLVTAIRDQLGLRVEAARGVVPVLKIESIDKVPLGN
jgi:uncharacterized protein (TIGR03435 family)